MASTGDWGGRLWRPPQLAGRHVMWSEDEGGEEPAAVVRVRGWGRSHRGPSPLPFRSLEWAGERRESRGDGGGRGCHQAARGRTGCEEVDGSWHLGTRWAIRMRKHLSFSPVTQEPRSRARLPTPPEPCFPKGGPPSSPGAPSHPPHLPLPGPGLMGLRGDGFPNTRSGLMASRRP